MDKTFCTKVPPLGSSQHVGNVKDDHENKNVVFRAMCTMIATIICCVSNGILICHCSNFSTTLCMNKYTSVVIPTYIYNKT